MSELMYRCMDGWNTPKEFTLNAKKRIIIGLDGSDYHIIYFFHYW